ncbi:MAG: DUF1549 domain-containing protein, partial [Verrucomicrobiales bacterium]|nr:DUF1549 domain-containing protein [Verrucomicrobiales bacterium]
MNPDSKSSEELACLTSRMLDGDLSPGEMGRLAELLQASPDAHREFVQMSELHSMLEAEPDVQAALSRDHLPHNVVSLAGGKSVSADSLPAVPTGNVPTGNANRPRWWIGAGIAAALAIGAFALLKQDKPGTSDETAAALAEAKPAQSIEVAPPPLEAEEEKPEKQYERAILATLGSGSQTRPPTNFTSEPSAEGEKISYNRDIRPILSDNCFSCHGPDEHGRKADLRLDIREGAVAGDPIAVVAGSPEESELVARILTADADDLMPPPESHKKLTPAQIDLLTRWVTEGAEYEEHWAFLPIANAEPEDWKGSAIDFFVDEKLQKMGLSRAEEASRRTIIRRATLDLTGLPPTPQEIEAFVSNDSPDVYEKLIDELLARPTFGEHRARYWLDAARYGDTHGLHLDNYREMWPYRDWVINA